MQEKQIVFPSLSRDGWVTDTTKMADKVLSCFFTSEFSQSYTYNGNITSFPYILATTGDDPPRMARVVEEQLTRLLSRYFNNVQVDSEEVTNQEDPNKGAISIAATFDDENGVKTELVKILELQNTDIRRIINVNNG